MFPKEVELEPRDVLVTDCLDEKSRGALLDGKKGSVAHLWRTGGSFGFLLCVLEYLLDWWTGTPYPWDGSGR